MTDLEQQDSPMAGRSAITAQSKSADQLGGEFFSMMERGLVISLPREPHPQLLVEP